MKKIHALTPPLYTLLLTVELSQVRNNDLQSRSFFLWTLVPEEAASGGNIATNAGGIKFVDMVA